MAHLTSNRFEPARRLSKTVAFLGLVLVTVALAAFFAEHMLSVGQSSASPDGTLRFNDGLVSADVAFAALGSLFIVLIWLVFRSRDN